MKNSHILAAYQRFKRGVLDRVEDPVTKERLNAIYWAAIMDGVSVVKQTLQEATVDNIGQKMEEFHADVNQEALNAIAGLLQS